MGFSIVHIKHPVKRRALLLLLFIPVVVIQSLIEIMKKIWRMSVDAERAFESAWRGH